MLRIHSIYIRIRIMDPQSELEKNWSRSGSWTFLLFSTIQIWILRVKKFFFFQFLVHILPLGQGLADSKIFADLDPWRKKSTSSSFSVGTWQYLYAVALQQDVGLSEDSRSVNPYWPVQHGPTVRQPLKECFINYKF